jgi:hypothetical protein
MFTRSKVWAAALLVTVFIAGGATGWVVSHSAGDAPPRGGNPDVLTAYLARRLDLDAAHQDAVRAVLERHHSEMQTIMSTVRPRLDSLRATVRSEISGQLTPAQRARYTRLLTDLDHQRDERARRDSIHSNASQH